MIRTIRKHGGKNRSDEPHPDYDKDYPEFRSWLSFDWTADGRLYSVYLRSAKEGAVVEGEKLVGKLDLSGCTGLRCVRIRGQNITSLDVTDCVMPVVDITGCTEIELIESGGTKLTSLIVALCPKVKKIRWLSPEWTYEDIGYYEGDSTLMTKEADITLEGRDGGIAELKHFDYHADPMAPLKFAIIATPQEGHKFLGWYDTNGKLISKDYMIPIFEDGIDRYNDEKISLLELVGSNEIHLIAKFK